MSKHEIAKLPVEEQEFIRSYGLEKYSIETIRTWVGSNNHQLHES